MKYLHTDVIVSTLVFGPPYVRMTPQALYVLMFSACLSVYLNYFWKS